MREKKWGCRTISVIIKFRDFEITQKAATFPVIHHDAFVLRQQAGKLLEQIVRSKKKPIRLVGFKATNLVKLKEKTLDQFIDITGIQSASHELLSTPTS